MKKTLKYIEYLDLESRKTKLHHIVFDDNIHGGMYRQITVIESMISRADKRWFDHWNAKKFKTHHTQPRFYRHHKHDDIAKESSIKLLKKKGLSDNDINQIFPKSLDVYHESVWAFFDAIGFDYKDKTVANTDSLILIEQRDKKS